MGSLNIIAMHIMLYTTFLFVTEKNFTGVTYTAVVSITKIVYNVAIAFCVLILFVVTCGGSSICKT